MDVYKIAVEIALAGNIENLLTGIGTQLTGLHGQVTKLNEAFGGWGTTLAVGAVAGIGLMALGIKNMLEDVDKLSTQLTTLKQLGASPEIYSDVRQRAIDTARLVPGTTETSNVRLFNEIYSIAGPEEAMRLMPQLARAGQVFGRGMGNFEEGNEKLFEVMRAADIIGRLSDPETKKFDPERFQHFLDIVTKVGTSTGWKVNPDTWLGMAKQGGISMRGLSDEGLMEMSAFAQNMGGGRAGTAMMSLFQQMAGGTMFPRVATELEKLKLLGPKGKVDKETGVLDESGGAEWGMLGQRVVVADKALKRLSEIFKTDPLKGLTDVLMPAMKAQGFETPDDQIRELFKVLQRATTQRMLGEGTMNVNQMLAEVERMKGAQGTDQAAITQNAGDITTALHNLSAAFTELKLAIGGSDGSISILTGSINRITGAVNGINEGVRALTAVVSMATISKAFDILSRAMVPVSTILDALGWIGTNAALLQSGASAIKAVGDAISAFIAKIAGIVPSWMKGTGAPSTPGSSSVPPLNFDPATGMPLPQQQNYVPGNTGFGGLLHNASFTPSNTGGFGNLLQNSSFAPPSSNTKFIVIHTALNIDGATLAREVEGQIAELHELPDAASSGNGIAYNTLNDWNPGIG